MRLDKEVLHENRKMALGCFVCTALVLAGFLIARKSDCTVVLGGMVGWMLAVGNFFFMSLGIAKALETGDENAAKLKMRSSYIARTVVMIVVMALAILLDFIHWIPVVLSVFYPRIVITAEKLLAFAKAGKKHLAGEDEETVEATEKEGTTVSADNTAQYDDDDEEDGFEKFAKTFWQAPVPGEEKNNRKKRNGGELHG